MRPPLPEHERRTRTLGIRMTEAEHAAVVDRAQLAGVSTTMYARAAVLGFRLEARPAVPAVNRELAADLSRLGGLLNQAMRAVHRGQGDVPVSVLEELRRQVIEVRAAVLGTEAVIE